MTVVYSMAPRLAQLLDHRGHGRLLLADGHVEAVHVLALLVDDRVDGDGGLAGLAVADDQLALAAADGDHRVDGLDAGLHRLLDALAGDDAGGLDLDLAGVLGLDGTLAVDGHAQGVDHPADEGVAHRDLGDLARPLDGVAFLDGLEVAQEHGADVVLFQVEDQAHHALAEVEQLARHGRLQAVDAGDAVARFSTVPVSVTETFCSNPSISLRMIWLISSARICMWFPSMKSGELEAQFSTRARRVSSRVRRLPSNT